MVAEVALPWEEAAWEEDMALVSEEDMAVMEVAADTAAAATALEGAVGSALGLVMEVGSVWEAAAVIALEGGVSPLVAEVEEAPV